MRPVVVVLLSLVFVSAAAGCFPGDSGWECTSSTDCDPELSCRDFSGGHYCVDAGTTMISSKSTFSWGSMILMWGFGLLILGSIAFASAGKLGAQRRVQQIAAGAVVVLVGGGAFAYRFLTRAPAPSGLSAEDATENFRQLRTKICACQDRACVAALLDEREGVTKELAGARGVDDVSISVITSQIETCTSKLGH